MIDSNLMYGTIFAILFSGLFLFQGIHPFGEHYETIALAFSLLFPLAVSLIWAGSYLALQHGELTSTPKSLELLRSDSKIHAAVIFLFLWPLLALTPKPQLGDIALWILIGAGLDSLRFMTLRVLDHLNPFRLIQLLQNASLLAIQQDKQTYLCETIEAMGEMGKKAILRGNSTLANQAVDALSKTCSQILSNERSTGKDTLTYLMLFILQQLESLFQTALKHGGGLSLGNLTTATAKLASYAATVDISLTLYPLHYLRRMVTGAVSEGHLDVGTKTSAGVMALAKEIAELPGLQSLEIEPTYHSLINILEETAKGTFKKDKSTPLPILRQPFLDLKKMFSQPPLSIHQDAKPIQNLLDHIIADFEALEAVLKKLPPLPNLSEIKEPEIANPPVSPGG